MSNWLDFINCKKKNSLNTKRVRGIFMLQSLSFLVISVMFYCSLSFCKIIRQTLYQRLYQSHVTFTPDPLSGNTKLSSQYRPRSTILLRLPPVIIWKVQTGREAIKRDILGGDVFKGFLGLNALMCVRPLLCSKLRWFLSDINFSFKKSLVFFPLSFILCSKLMLHTTFF